MLAVILLAGQTKGVHFVISGSLNISVTRTPIKGAVDNRWPIDHGAPAREVPEDIPFVASSAYICPELEPAYITPFATLTEPLSIVLAVGSAVCQRIFPVATSRALQAPQVICCPDGTKV